ncbi:MAG: PP2C family protein-serine/threonine phosphatase [Anaerolineae bacterium]|nr:PP2C family protein-serine/threonine phosphatase [Anaerolineae bacterium]
MGAKAIGSSATEEWIQRLIERLSPEAARLSEGQRAGAGADLFNALYNAPLAILALGWLIVETDLTLVREHWLLFLLTIPLAFLFERLGFYVTVELRRGVPATAAGTLESMFGLAAVLVVGPAGLWSFVIVHLIRFFINWRRINTAPSLPGIDARTLAWIPRTRELVGNLSVITVTLFALTLYRSWGGTFPIPDLAPANFLRGLITLLLSALLQVLLYAPYMWYITRSTYFGQDRASRSQLFSLFIMLIALTALTDPFAVVLAGNYMEHGWLVYSLLVFGLFLVSLLAHNLSQQRERSDQRSRELEHLEQLGEALIKAPPDGSTFPQIFQEHVPAMFLAARIEVLLFPDRRLVSYPPESSDLAEQALYWLRDQRTNENGQMQTTMHFKLRQELPWLNRPSPIPINLVPILDAENGAPIGGIYLSRGSGVKTVPEVLPAMQSLAAQIASALHSTRIYENTLSSQRLLHELTMAGQIQASFLPESLPTVPGWQIAVMLDPARETSGDFYDLIELPNGRLGMVVADVADKGMGAALYMALSRTLIRTFAAQFPDHPAQVLGAANSRILMDTRTEQFVTVFYAILDPREATLTYCSAGHNPAYLLSAHDGGAAPQHLGKTGIPLGIFDDVTWRETSVTLRTGDALIVYTDGVTEAQNSEQELFGEDRLLSSVRGHLRESAETLQTALLADVRNFTGDAPQFDDITLLVLTRKD